MSLYKNYILEKTNDRIIESEKGFMTYTLDFNGAAYIKDVYILPEYRQFGVASEMAAQVRKEAKEKGIKMLYTSVVTNLNDSTTSLKAILAYGFKLDSTANNFILLKMEI